MLEWCQKLTGELLSWACVGGLSGNSFVVEMFVIDVF